MNEPPIVHRSIGSLQTSVAVLGEGSPVIALHGWGGSIQSFWSVAQRLAPAGYQVHLLDLPGFGKTDLPPQPWGIEEYKRFVVAYLDDAGLDQVAVLGHSFGGRIGLVLAAEHPERVRKMVLADSAGLRSPLSISHQLRQTAAKMLGWGLQTVGLEKLRTRWQAGYNQRYASEDYLTAGPLRETFVRVIREDLAPYARRIQAPTLLIWGDQDKDTPLWQGQKLEKLIPDAGLVVFQGAGHFAYLERLADYIRIVDHFLRSG